MYGDFAFLLRNPHLQAQLQQQWAVTEPMALNMAKRLGAGLTRFTGDRATAMVAQADQRIAAAKQRATFARETQRQLFPRFEGLIKATLAETAASPSGFRIVYHPDGTGFALTHDQEKLLRGARLFSAERTIRVSSPQNPPQADEDELPGIVRQPAYGFEGMLPDGRLIILVNTLTTEKLPGDLKAALLVTAQPHLRDLNPGWRKDAAHFDGEALPQSECAAQACFVFPVEATNNLRAGYGKMSHVPAEVYLGTTGAFPIPTDIRKANRSQLRWGKALIDSMDG